MSRNSQRSQFPLGGQSLAKFQPLLCWIVVRDRLKFSGPMPSESVSILVVLDRCQRQTSSHVLEHHSRVSILVVLDRCQRQVQGTNRGPGYSAQHVSILVVLDRCQRPQFGSTIAVRSTSLEVSILVVLDRCQRPGHRFSVPAVRFRVVSILVVLDRCQRRVSNTGVSSECVTFQSLLCWIVVRDLLLH